MTWIRSLDPRARMLVALAALVVVVGAVTAFAATRGDDDTAAVRTDASSTTLRSTTTSSSSSSTSTSVVTDPSATTTVAVTPGGATGTTRPAAGTGTTATTKPRATATTQPPVTQPPVTQPPAPVTCNTSSGGNTGALAAKFCAYRSAQGLPTMSRTGSMDGVAQQWANKLAADHDANPGAFALPHRGDMQSAVLGACSKCTGWAENVAYAMDVNAIWSSWLSSSTHLANIRDGSAGEFGFGVAQSNDGYLWAVQNFGRYP